MKGKKERKKDYANKVTLVCVNLEGVCSVLAPFVNLFLSSCKHCLAGVSLLAQYFLICFYKQLSDTILTNPASVVLLF